MHHRLAFDLLLFIFTMIDQFVCLWNDHMKNYVGLEREVLRFEGQATSCCRLRLRPPTGTARKTIKPRPGLQCTALAAPFDVLLTNTLARDAVVTFGAVLAGIGVTRAFSLLTAAGVKQVLVNTVRAIPSPGSQSSAF